MSAKKRIVLFYNGRVCTTGFYVEQTLRRLGFAVDVYNQFLAHFIAKRIKGCDLYLCVDDSSHYSFPPELSPSVLWLIDTPYSLRLDSMMVKFFDFCFCAQRTYCFALEGLTSRRVYWLPLACFPEFHKRYTKRKDKLYDVAFVGSMDKRRQSIKDMLTKRGYSVYFGTAHCRLIGDIYSQAKIGLNFNKKFDLNMRTFEVMCAGALLMTEDFDGRLELFKDSDMVVFKGYDDMFEKIEYYLRNEQERNDIAQKGHEEVLRKHKYDDRIRDIINTVESSEPNKKEIPSFSEMLFFQLLESVRQIYIRSGLRELVVRKIGPISI